MRNLIWLSVSLFWGCSSITQSDSKKVDINKFYEGWDSTTKQALSKYTVSDNAHTGKANFILKSLQHEESSIDILDRKSFYKTIRNNFVQKNPEDTSIIIVELNQTGEKNSYRKYVIRNSDSCAVFERDIKGEWGIINKTKISQESASYLQNLKTDTIANNSWGGGINDICIITKINHDSTIVSPIFYLPVETFYKLLNRLQR